MSSRLASAVRLLVVAGALALAGAGCGGEKTAATPETAAPATSAPATTTEPPGAVPTETRPPKIEAPPAPPASTATPAPAVTKVAIVVRGGGSVVVGGIKRATIEKGSRVVLVVTSDVADEVHLHGYDKHVAVTPGKTGRLRFVATARGRFEVELEQHRLQIADLTVK